MITTKVYVVEGNEGEKTHSEASAFQMGVKGSLKGGLIILNMHLASLASVS